MVLSTLKLICRVSVVSTQTPPSPPPAPMDFLRKPDYGQAPAYLASVKVRHTHRAFFYSSIHHRPFMPAEWY